VALANNAPLHVYFKTISGTGVVYIDDVSVAGLAGPVGSAVPTLNDWVMMALAALLMLTGWTFLRKRLPNR
jgi:hypothetical protein